MSTIPKPLKGKKRLVHDLETASDGNRELDVRISIVRGCRPLFHIGRLTDEIVDDWTIGGGSDLVGWRPLPHYSTDVKAIASAMRKGTSWLLSSDGTSGKVRADINHDKKTGWGMGTANTPALALCAAFIAKSAA